MAAVSRILLTQSEESSSISFILASSQNPLEYTPILLAAKVVCHDWLLVEAAPQKALGLCHVPHRLLLWSKLDEVPRDVQTATASDGQCEL